MSRLSKLAAAKIVFERGKNYASIVQFLLVIFLAIRELQQTNMGGLLPRTAILAPAGLVIALAGMMVLGYIDYRFLYGHEQERASAKNPALQQILSRLESIEAKLSKR